MGVTAITEIITGEKRASAANRAVASQLNAQSRMRAEDLALRRESRDKALEFAEASPEELAAIERTIEINEQDIASKQQLIDSVDPALREAGAQALQIMQGQEAQTLDPIRRARAEQKETLRNRLLQQFGTGFENTSAGIRALNDFDAETDSLLSIEQDRTLGRLLGSATNSRQLASLSPNIAASGTIADLFGGIQRRQVAAVQGTPLSSPFQVEGTSANFAGEAIRAGSQGSAVGQLLGGVTLAGMLGGGAGGFSLQQLIGNLNPSGQSAVSGTAGGLDSSGGGLNLGGVSNVMVP